MTITVKLFDSVSNIVDISIDRALDCSTLADLDPMILFKIKKKRKFFKTYKKRSRQQIQQSGTHSCSAKGKYG